MLAHYGKRMETLDMTPEVKLWQCVISLTVQDWLRWKLEGKDESNGSSAKRFIESDQFASIVDLIGMDGARMQKLLLEHPAQCRKNIEAAFA